MGPVGFGFFFPFSVRGECSHLNLSDCLTADNRGTWQAHLCPEPTPTPPMQNFLSLLLPCLLTEAAPGPSQSAHFLTSRTRDRDRPQRLVRHLQCLLFLSHPSPSLRVDQTPLQLAQCQSFLPSQPCCEACCPLPS